MAEADELLTVAEIAPELKMNHQTIRNWIDSGYLPAIRVGRRVPVKLGVSGSGRATAISATARPEGPRIRALAERPLNRGRLGPTP